MYTTFPCSIGSGNSMAVVIGITVPIALIAVVIAFLIVALLVFFFYKQYKIRHSLKVRDLNDPHGREGEYYGY